MHGARSRIGLSGALLIAGLTAMLAGIWLISATAPAEAQERRGRPLFELLFGGGNRQQSAPAERVEPRPRVRRQPSSGSRAGGPAAVPRPSSAVEKAEDAAVLLVVGDFMGGGLAEGLEAAFASNPDVRIVSRANGSSGFVRDDYYNWPAEIGPILDEVKPAAVAVMIGSNDRQQLVVDGSRENVGSDPWVKEYTSRVRALASAIRDRQLPFVWVGLPSFRTAAMSADMVAFNDIHRGVVEELGGEFVDIWDGFVDENGAFAAMGPDMNGQRVRLRGSDGINMSGAGKRKVAFYAERPLNRILSDGARPGIAALPGSPDEPMGPQAPATPAEILRTQPIALGDPALDGGSALLGTGRPRPGAEPTTPGRKLTVEGMAPSAQPGRADNFQTMEAAKPDAADQTGAIAN